MKNSEKEFVSVTLGIENDGTVATVIGFHSTEKAAEQSLKTKGLTGYQGRGEKRILKASVEHNNNYALGDSFEL